ncbi:hypothetical protein AK812_SmicGene26555 [Symbiodinium microadriaticum]|uniref:Uncharacterized protein n=1 Tax=Symbiodinium microadriaticum TaxID=2951 RepID=A0A1Q9D972_SYMMI|nr:hypothetical protein AK812_SmicGene26555 [Symbiodinium microadriaticum]
MNDLASGSKQRISEPSMKAARESMSEAAEAAREAADLIRGANPDSTPPPDEDLVVDEPMYPEEDYSYGYDYAAGAAPGEREDEIPPGTKLEDAASSGRKTCDGELDLPPGDPVSTSFERLRDFAREFQKDVDNSEDDDLDEHHPCDCLLEREDSSIGKSSKAKYEAAK